MNALVWAVPVIAVLAILVALLLARSVWMSEPATPEMRRARDVTLNAARVSLIRQSRIMFPVAIIVALGVGALVFFATKGEQERGARAILTALSLIVGACVAGCSVFVRLMLTARTSVIPAGTVAFRGGAASGVCAVALSLLGGSGLLGVCIVTRVTTGLRDAPPCIVGYAFGVSLVAFCVHLQRAGFTSIASRGITLLDLDEEADSAFLCASFTAGIVGATLVGVALARATEHDAFVSFPGVLVAFGLLAAMIGVAATRIRANGYRGFLIVIGLSAVFLVAVCYRMLHGIMRTPAEGSIPLRGAPWMYVALAGCVGLAASVAFVYLPRAFPALPWRLIHVFVIALTLGGAYFLGTLAQITGKMLQDGAFGVAVAMVGMLMSAGYVFAMGVFAPRMDGVRSSGTTNARAGVGDRAEAYAFGAAALAGFVLFCAFLDQVASARGYTPGSDGWNASHRVDIAQPKVFIGALLGLMLVLVSAPRAIPAPRAARDLFAPAAFVVLLPLLVGVTLRAEGAAGFLIVAIMGGILLALVAREDGGAGDIVVPAPQVVIFVGTLLLTLAPLFL